MGVETRDNKTVLAHTKRSGPLAVQRPFYPEGGRCHIYLLHPPGGVVGGDGIDIQLNAASQTQTLLTTPGAAKYYRSARERALVKQTLVIEDDACVEWLPQENIFFPGCNVQMQTRVELASRSSITLWDIQCFGKPANNEPFDEGYIDSRLTICRDDQPLLLERQRVDPIRRRYSALLAGHPVSAVCIATHTTQAALTACREVTSGNPSIALTLIDDLLIARYLGDSTNEVRKLFTQIWQVLRKLKTGNNTAMPRIWLT